MAQQGDNMLAKEIETHRDVVTLRDGVRVLIRPMIREDKEMLVEFFKYVSDDDLRYVRHNVRDRRVVEKWCDELDYSKVLPVLAIVKDRIVGNGSLHYFVGPKRHIAEYRLFLAKDFRQRGLGMKMTRAIIDMARKRDVRIITGEIVAEHTKVIRAFEGLGFKSQCLLEDYFMFPDGDCADVVFMTLNLKPHNDEF
jgi:L-amino acid N-acyltransferase YncA